MFGYLTADTLAMPKELRKEYRNYYCGLCECLNIKYGNTGRLTLSYDLTFVAILLTDVYNAELTVTNKHCPIHPLTKVTSAYSKYFDFAADMNILLKYYKYIDDINDENSSKAKRKARHLQPFVNEISLKYPEKCKIIEDGLKEIANMEKENVLNPDLPANAFGKVMSELFYIDSQDNYSKELKNFGFHLGKYIYLIDAVCDLKKDIKSGNYTPLVSLENLNSEEMLNLVMENAEYFYDKLPLKRFKAITDNVMYTGLWLQFDQHKQLERNIK